jgi:hypothetical protein
MARTSPWGTDEGRGAVDTATTSDGDARGLESEPASLSLIGSLASVPGRPSPATVTLHGGLWTGLARNRCLPTP